MAQKFFKVYEICDNTEEILAVYPTYFVGAFQSKEKAQKLCNVIDIASCNSTKIIYGEINVKDIQDIKQHGITGCDRTGYDEIKRILNHQQKTQSLEEITFE